MRRLTTATALLLATSGVATAQWYVGGNLHSATAQQWSAASADNRLATAGDWTARILGEDRVLALGLEGVRPIAQQLASCVTQSAPQSAPDTAVQQLAGACAQSMGLR